MDNFHIALWARLTKQRGCGEYSIMKVAKYSI